MSLIKKIIAAVPLSLLLATLSVMASSIEEGKEALQNENYTFALEQFQLLAEKGDAEAQLFLGGMYLRGEGVDQNLEEAAE